MKPDAQDLLRLADAETVMAELTARFGPGFSSGVHALLLHNALPERFDKSDWAEWFFKPADAAFEYAFDRGLIAPWKLSSKWVFTPLGQACRVLARAHSTKEVSNG